MSAQFIFPKPRDWETFEDIVCDVFSRKYQSYNLQRFARRGQAQNGVDIVGPIDMGILGIQCKHHPNAKITISEIDEEVKKSEKYQPSLTEYIIATSASRDNDAHKHVLKISEIRKAQSKYPVLIKFWEDIYDWLTEYPDLLYKHFTKYFPIDTLETLRLPGIERVTRKTLCWPTSIEDLRKSTSESLKFVSQVDAYHLTLGISTFSDVSFEGRVDLELQLADLFSRDNEPIFNFQQATAILNEVRLVISDASFSKHLTVYPQVRLTLALLLGWVFRRVTHYELTLVHRDQIWATSGLPYVPSKIVDELPYLMDTESSEVALVLNITRNIQGSVMDYIDSWSVKPRAVLNYRSENYMIDNGAHALTVARELSRKIRNLADVWQVSRIHLFVAMPAALATLIGYHLNAICPISIYFLDEYPAGYKLGGVIQRGM